jgi:integrase
MPTQKLTAKTIENVKPPVSGRLELWDSTISTDTSLSGSFGLRITANGAKSWVVMYRLDGRLKRETIGSYPAYSLLQAREQARVSLEMAGRGIDPVASRKAEKIKVAAIKTVLDAVEVFIQRHAKQKNRSWREVERVFNYYIIPKMGERPLPSITPADIHEVLDALMDAKHPYMANRVFAHTRKFFNWCAERHWIGEPPTKHISRPADEEARDRVLNNGEIERLWRGCDGLGWPFGPYIKLLLVTGQRRNEVAGMKWEQIDLGNKLWTLPREETKAKRQHEVPLSPMAIELLENVPRNGKYVFSTTGKTPISGFSKAKERCDKIMARVQLEATGKKKWTDNEFEKNLIPAWRLHDIRRTVASGMAEIGIAPHVIEKVLNHSTGQISGVAAVYNRHTYLREKTDALYAWARALQTIVGTPERNVVEMAISP